MRCVPFALAFASVIAGCNSLTAPPEPIGNDQPSAATKQKPAAEPKGDHPQAKPEAPPPDPNAKLEIVEVAPGKGTEVAKAGDRVAVHYTGKLPDGKQFDSSIGRTPIQFELGAGRVIKGWDQGIAGMKVGQKRKLIIPPALGYGAAGAGPDIPPNATLHFDVELVSITPKK
jgi:FKBP-type peptidyl-prolyl cis-trans isomerase FkpA